MVPLMSLKTVFLSSIQNMQYVFPNGKAAIFTNGQFITDVESEIAHLKDEIRNGIPHISQDPDASKQVIDTTLQDRIRDAQAAVTLQIMKEHEEGVKAPVTGVLDEALKSQANQAPESTLAENSGDALSSLIRPDQNGSVMNLPGNDPVPVKEVSKKANQATVVSSSKQ